MAELNFEVVGREVVESSKFHSLVLVGFIASDKNMLHCS